MIPEERILVLANLNSATTELPTDQHAPKSERDGKPPGSEGNTPEGSEHGHQQ